MRASNRRVMNATATQSLIAAARNALILFAAIAAVAYGAMFLAKRTAAPHVAFGPWAERVAAAREVRHAST